MVQLQHDARQQQYQMQDGILVTTEHACGPCSPPLTSAARYSSLICVGLFQRKRSLKATSTCCSVDGAAAGRGRRFRTGGQVRSNVHVLLCRRRRCGEGRRVREWSGQVKRPRAALWTAPLRRGGDGSERGQVRSNVHVLLCRRRRCGEGETGQSVVRSNRVTMPTGSATDL